MQQIKDEIVVFSDANTKYDPNSIKKLIVHFTNPKVGCVCGRLVYRNPGEILSGKGESFYWRYETALKKLESKIGYIAGANGAIYAIRRSLFEPLPMKTINDDFTVSMKIVEKGFKSLYEENALAHEEVAPNMKSEFKRHVRDGAGHFIAIGYLLKLLNPFLGVRSLIYWSHRIFRWVAPFMLILVFISNILLIDRLFYLGLFLIQVMFYAFALIGLFSERENRKLPFLTYIPFYFCNLNAALLYGFIRVISGVQKTTWESTTR
jgi:cellulose synthase/poly-beta-1,6-N-acetylglucosamine synthase-like glycosyltransferase